VGGSGDPRWPRILVLGKTEGTWCAAGRWRLQPSRFWRAQSHIILFFIFFFPLYGCFFFLVGAPRT